MRILVDESLPRYLKQVLSDHETFTVQEMGWTGIRNGDLLTRAGNRFDVFLTADKNLRHQQNLVGCPFAVIVFPSNKLSIVKVLVPQLRQALKDTRRGDVLEL